MVESHIGAAVTRRSTAHPSLSELRAQRSELAAQARETGVRFLWSELAMAEVFICIADATSQCEHSLRNLRKAWLALEVAEEFARKLDLPFPERHAFRDRHLALCHRLTNLRVGLQD
jgi:hypothetical protein